MNELADYDFELPPELIAQSPLENRSEARLLVVERKTQTISHRRIRDLPEFLEPTDTLVVNDTRVIPARLIGRRSRTGGAWEGLFLGLDSRGLWTLMCKTRGKLESGEIIALETPDGRPGLALELREKTPDGNWIARAKTEEPALAAIERVGRVPIPPYIRGGKMLPSDRENYQTVFASEPGAIAAPTAGFHFTKPLLDEIRALGIAVVPVTLHVGVGTFRPITAERLDEHRMHSEWCSLGSENAATIRSRRAGGGRTVAIGTTSVRVLETVCRARGELAEFAGETSLFIRPPYTWQAVDVLLTNFHFPKSTLYILVRTFGGDALIREAYAEAIRLEYRFFSYGDAMLIV